MVDVADVIGLLVILGINTAIAALLTRFFRVRLKTDWGSAAYIIFFGPVVMFVLVLILSGPLKLGTNLGSPAIVVGTTVVLPLSMGVAFDFFWMPAPDEVDLPEKYAS